MRKGLSSREGMDYVERSMINSATGPLISGKRCQPGRGNGLSLPGLNVTCVMGVALRVFRGTKPIGCSGTERLFT